MKAFISILIFALFAVPVFSQNIMIKAGGNFSKIAEENDLGSYTDDIDMKAGFHIGATVEFPLSGNAVVETGLLASTKGYKYSYDDVGESLEETGNFFYLDVPILAKVYFDAGNARVFGLAGPYVGLGIGGKTKVESTVMGQTFEEEVDIEWGNDENDHLKPLDFGVTVGAGVDLGVIQVSANYSLGMANISAYTGEGYSIKNRVISVMLGYDLTGE